MRNAPLGRRLGAIIYDGLLVIALQLLGTVPFVALEGGDIVEPGTLAHQLTVLAIAWLFFCGFWTRAGRTLGMQSWRLHVHADHGADNVTNQFKNRSIVSLSHQQYFSNLIFG